MGQMELDLSDFSFPPLMVDVLGSFLASRPKGDDVLWNTRENFGLSICASVHLYILTYICLHIPSVLSPIGLRTGRA